MNAKNIILAILMVLSFAACSSEIEGIDNNMANNTANPATASTSIVVNFSAGELITKSGVSDGIAKVSDEEMNIDEYVIAVFEKQTGDRVGFTTGKNVGSKVSSQTIQNIDCKEGEVIVYVVANASAEQFTSLYTRTDFESVRVENLNNLVKVGKQETKLEQGETNSLEIELSQLTARVKVNFEVSVKSNEDVTFKANNYVATIARSSAIHDVKAIDGMSSTVDISSESLNISSESFTYYTYAVTNPTLALNGTLTVTDKAEDNTKEVTIKIPFEKGSQTLSSLKDGVSYEITVEATLTVGINATPEISYKIHKIETIDQGITFN